MNTVKQEDKSIVGPTVIEDIRWCLGSRTHSLGEYLVKLGDRIHGDGPLGLEEAYKLGHAMGTRKPGEAIDMDMIFTKASV